MNAGQSSIHTLPTALPDQSETTEYDGQSFKPWTANFHRPGNPGAYFHHFMNNLETIAAILFATALAHTFAAKWFERLANRSVSHAGLFHLLGEVEVVFGLWAFVLIVFIAMIEGGVQAIAYAEARQYTEPLFVFVVMIIAASRPIFEFVKWLIAELAKLAPVSTPLAKVWLCLALVPLTGSLITEPAAMTLAALMLVPFIAKPGMPEWLKYGVIGVLFVNVSIGGTLTSFAAPPILMVAAKWDWDSAFMAANFGWKAAVAVLINATVLALILRPYLNKVAEKKIIDKNNVPLFVSAVHLLFLIAVIIFSHHPVIFLGFFLFFLGYTKAYENYQSPLIFKEGLLVGFFLAGLVVLGSMQQWWLQPIVSGLNPTALYFATTILTAITDNAALTYLGALNEGMSDQAKYMLVAGAVTGGGLTVIANAPNPAGAALLREGFKDERIGAAGLLAGAALPTVVTAVLFLM